MKLQYTDSVLVSIGQSSGFFCFSGGFFKLSSLIRVESIIIKFSQAIGIMGKANQGLRSACLLLSLLLLLSACDALKDLAGISETKPSDIKGELFADDLLKECVARLTAGLFAAEVFDIFCSGNAIFSIDGLEQFPNLRSLVIAGNRLSEVDLSPFPKLQLLVFSGGRLNKIDLSHNPLLIEVKLDENSISELDLSKNKKLVSLVLSKNDISALDLSNNLELQELVLDNNAFVGSVSDGPEPLLNLQKNIKLNNLNLFGNQITYIDVHKNVRLDYLDLRQNQLLEINVSLNQNLTELRLSDNQLLELDISNNLNLDRIWAANNLITRIDLPAAGKLRFIFLNNNLIDCDNLDCTSQNYFLIPGNRNLIHVDLRGNLLTNADINLLDNQDFSELLLADNPGIVGTFDLTFAKRLVELNLDGTGVTDFNFGPTPVTTYKDFFNLFSMKVFSAIGAPLDQDTKTLFDKLEKNKKKHDQYNPDNPDSIKVSY